MHQQNKKQTTLEAIAENTNNNSHATKETSVWKCRLPLGTTTTRRVAKGGVDVHQKRTGKKRRSPKEDGQEAKRSCQGSWNAYKNQHSCSFSNRTCCFEKEGTSKTLYKVFGDLGGGASQKKSFISNLQLAPRQGGTKKSFATEFCQQRNGTKKTLDRIC